eukprot:CAMPEP_0178743478 /NCGR_PEP_ID=MMETSP0744-20121128/6228_1 /TAXON_ID=913974 /ORGANISM="Nitzschia punctata, Strain CCMP561" /LENGTH=53 /DNA_ID=CAMNT_0020396487 /DNA_START=116 /DNA_END=273 /DNA_ORIENTATION=-
MKRTRFDIKNARRGRLVVGFFGGVAVLCCLASQASLLDQLKTENKEVRHDDKP